ncbi:MAG: glycosyltransferase family 39 protein [Pseudomonadota bacterium]
MATILSRRLSLLICLAAIIAAALWFRINGITAHPFWLDEAYSAYAADKGFGFIFNVLPSYETHPPFYSAILSAWAGVFGNSIAAFRSLGLFAGLLLFPLCWVTANEVARALKFDSRLFALAALALLAVSPSIVYITKLVRPYALMSLAYLLGIWCVFVLARRYRETKQLEVKPWLGYLTSLALIIWLHNLGALYAVALGLTLLILVGPVSFIRNHLRSFFIGHFLVALVVLPAFLMLLDQAPTWQQSAWLRFSWGGVGLSLYTIYGLSGFGAFAISALMIGNAIFKTGKSKRLVWLGLFTLAFLPMLLSLLATVTIVPVFLSRTLAPLSVVFVLVLAAATAAPSILNRVGFLAMLLLTSIEMVAIQKLPPTENWYSAVAWLKSHMAPGDVIYAYPNEGALPLSYALRDKGITLPIRPIPGPVPANDPTGWFPTGSRGVVSLPQYRLEAIAADAQSRKTRTVWLLRLGASTYDKNDGFLNALSRTRRIIGHWNQNPIDIIGLRQSPQVTPREQAKP